MADPGGRPPLAALLADQRRRAARGAPFATELYLGRYPDLADDPDALLDLIYNEVVLHEGLGRAPDLAAYQARFPALAAPLADLFEVHRALDAVPPDDATEGGTRTDPVPPPEPSAGETAPPGAGVPDPAGGFPALEGYEVLDVLGRGGMGVVYRARDLKRGVTVAVKTMRQVDAAGLYRFKQEFRALLGVAHPNLVGLYELISDGRAWYIVMEYVDGQTFLDHVRGGDGGDPAPEATPPALDTTWSAERPSFDLPAPPPPCATPPPVPGAAGLGEKGRVRLRRALRQLAEGLAALHQAGKLHRDIKPSNVMVARDGRVVLMDFGLVTSDPSARDGPDPSTEGQVVGTAAYMAPEQAAGRRLTPAADWYGVGTMIYEALTGRRPFPGGMLQALIDKQSFEPPPPRELAPGVPEDLDALCVALLRRDPAARPPGREVLARLGAAAAGGPGAGETPSTGASDLPLVGRGAHLDALADALAALGSGRTVVVSLFGPSGVGKSALVQAFLDGLAARGEVVTLAGRCYERESVPYKALDSLIDALSRYLHRLPAHEAAALLPRDMGALARTFPVLRRVDAVAAGPRRGSDSPDPREQRRRSDAALRELLARLGDRRPLVLAIDDLQWADPDSLAVLAELLRPPDPPVLLLLACYRSDGPVALPGEAAGVDRRALAVGPLAPGEAAELARLLLRPAGGDAAGLAEAVARESGGNPFFAAELARAALSGADDPGGGRAAPAAARVAPDLDGVLWARVARLPAEARALLEVVAVAGGPVPAAVAWNCLDHDRPGDERAAFALLRSARLVRGSVGGAGADGERVEAYHDRVRETVVARLGPDALRDRHRRLAGVLEATGRADPEVLGAHHLGAGAPERAAVEFARAAARAAEALAFDRASALYRQALELRPDDDDEERRRLRAALAEALANAGRGAEAAEAYLDACRGATVAEARERRRRAAMQFLISGHIDRGMDALRDVLAAVGLALPRTPRRALASLLCRRALLRLRGLGFRPRDPSEVAAADLTRVDVCWSAGVGLSNVDWVRGADFQARGLVLALRAGEPTRVARALAVEAAQTAAAGRPARARTARLLQNAGALARRSDDPYALGMVALAGGVSSYLEARWADARLDCDRAEAVFRDRCTGVAWELDTAHAYALWALSHLGRWAELSRRFPVLIDEARARGDLYAVMNLSTYILSVVRLAADDPAAVREAARGVLGQWSRDGYHVQHNDLVWATVQTDLYDGDGPAAWSGLARHWPTLARSLLLRVQFIRVAMWGLRARSALAAASAPGVDPRPYLRAAARDARRLDREGLPWSRAQARLARAGVAAREGRAGPAAGLLREAAALFREADMAVCAAVADLRLGSLLGGDEGRDLLARARGFLSGEAVRRPDRVAALFAPGFPDPPPPPSPAR